MKIKYEIKRKIMLSQIKKQNIKKPFDLDKYERHQLENDATYYNINSYYFSAHNLNGESLLLRQAIRGEGHLEIWFIYHDGKKTYANLKSTYQNEESPVKLTCVKPGEKWLFSFQGKVSKMDVGSDKIAKFSDKIYDFDVEGEFISKTDMFDFTYHLDPNLLASVIANEKWDKTFQENSRYNQQVHSEQQGHINATIKFNDKEIKFSSPAMRDHSFGIRNWNYMERHIWLMALLGEEESMNLNLVSYPHMRNLKTGYYEKDGEVNQISLDTDITTIPNIGVIPEKFSYQVVLQNKDIYNITATPEVIIPFEFEAGKYYLYEGIGTYDINGRKARGVLEFGFNENEDLWKNKK